MGYICNINTTTGSCPSAFVWMQLLFKEIHVMNMLLSKLQVRYLQVRGKLLLVFHLFMQHCVWVRTKSLNLLGFKNANQWRVCLQVYPSTMNIHKPQIELLKQVRWFTWALMEWVWPMAVAWYYADNAFVNSCYSSCKQHSRYIECNK